MAADRRAPAAHRMASPAASFGAEASSRAPAIRRPIPGNGSASCATSPTCSRPSASGCAAEKSSSPDRWCRRSRSSRARTPSRSRSIPSAASGCVFPASISRRSERCAAGTERLEHVQVKGTARAANSVLPSPLWGGIGGLRPPFLAAKKRRRFASAMAKRRGGGGAVICRWTPTATPPHKGEGSRPSSPLALIPFHTNAALDFLTARRSACERGGAEIDPIGGGEIADRHRLILLQRHQDDFPVLGRFAAREGHVLDLVALAHDGLERLLLLREGIPGLRNEHGSGERA